MESIFTLNELDYLKKAKIHILRKSPFFSYLVEHLKFKEAKGLGTCGVDEKGTFYYDPDFVQKNKDIKKLSAVFMHEVLHLAFEHPVRGKNKTLMINNVSVWNIAIDIVVNNIVQKYEWAELPKEAIIPKNDSIDIFGFTITDISKKSAEEIYWELVENLKNKHGEPQEIDMPSFNSENNSDSQGNNENKNKNEEGDSRENQEDKNKEGNGGENQESESDKNEEGNNGENTKKKGKGWKIDEEVKGFDKHIFNNKKQKKEKSENKIDWKKILAEAINYAKQKGEEPLGMEREFEVLKRGKVNWRAIIRNTIKSQIPVDFTWRRPNRKYVSEDIYIPSIKREGIEIVFAIDTSGSMSQKELSEAITEIISVAKSFDLVKARVITHDSEVQDDYEVKNGNIAKIKKIKIHGGGGTSHIPLYKYIEKKYPRTKLLISFTDGYSDFPDKTKIKTIFVLTGLHVAKSKMPDWAMKIIEIE